MRQQNTLNGDDHGNEQSAPKYFNKFTELMGWLQIFAAPFFIGLLLGLVAYLSIDSGVGLILGIALTTIGLIIGVIWATRVSQKVGANNYVSRIMSTPDVDSPRKD